ncbi:AraC family transcriptional regulator [Nocardia brasiliensis]|uniref:AraC family transcriptional regulator n=1 Tax=Nocardia brasiliensis TaxID=37326 RepID=UPI002458ED9A|nr:AraC family transcriptional regulator [Nocardia brasiliensis]
MAIMARAAGLRGYRQLADELGGDGTALLRRFGITPEALDSDDAILTSESMGWALEIAATELDCPDFGLRLAARQSLDVLGPLAVAMLNADTVGAALSCLQRYLFVQHAGLAIQLCPDPEQQRGMLALHYRDMAEVTSFSQGVDHGAGLVHRYLRHGVGGEYGLRAVHLPHAQRAPLSRYLEFFGAEVRFDMPTTLFRFPGELLVRPLVDRDPMLHKLAMDYLARNYSELDQTMTARVRLAVDRALVESSADIATVADMLTIGERSLQRALAAEGTTFTAVLDTARRDATYRLLCETDLPMGRITALVGLREQSALTRVVRRWYGTTPQRIRSAARDNVRPGR